MARSNEMDKVSITADWLVVARTLTDIPYSQEIYEILLEKKEGTQTEIDFQKEIQSNNASITPRFECRYKLNNKLMKENGAIKVLELASGLAPRGLQWTENPNVTYVEFDLPRKIEEKRQIVAKLLSHSKMKPRPNLYFEAGDVLNREDMITAVSHFHIGDGPIIIINEGLLRYLTHDQKKILAGNIKYLLERLGGCWITPDVNAPYVNQSDPISGLERLKARNEYLQSKGVQTHSFESVAVAKNFFEELGFFVEQRFFKEVFPEMVSTSRLNASQDELENGLCSQISFVMRCKST
jgi:O-methyltransferase involved in polyketide biosynthesis